MSDFHLGPTPAPPATALTGKGVVITRPLWQATSLATRLSTYGAIPFIFPAILIEPNPACDLAAAQRALAQCTKAFFVSANAVWEGLRERSTLPPHVVAYGPGPGTAEALRARGVVSVRIPERAFDTQGLLALPELASLHGERVMIFTGVGGKGDLAEGLRARGAQVDVVECYTRRAPDSVAEGLAEAWAAARIHAQVLTSAEGIGNFVRCIPAHSLPAFHATPAFVPHPNVARAAAHAGVRHVITAGPGDDALVAALHAYFAPC